MSVSMGAVAPDFSLPDTAGRRWPVRHRLRRRSSDGAGVHVQPLPVRARLARPDRGGRRRLCGARRARPGGELRTTPTATHATPSTRCAIGSRGRSGRFPTCTTPPRTSLAPMAPRPRRTCSCSTRTACCAIAARPTPTTRSPGAGRVAARGARRRAGRRNRGTAGDQAGRLLDQVEGVAAVAIRQRNVAVGGIDRQAGGVPLEHPAGHVVGVEPSVTECLGGHRRAATAAAVEDDRPVPVDALHLGREPSELDEPTAGDPPRLVLLGLAHVDQLDLVLLEQLGHLVRRVLHVVRLASVWRGPARCSSYSTPRWLLCARRGAGRRAGGGNRGSRQVGYRRGLKSVSGQYLPALDPAPVVLPRTGVGRYSGLGPTSSGYALNTGFTEPRRPRSATTSGTRRWCASSTR